MNNDGPNEANASPQVDAANGDACEQFRERLLQGETPNPMLLAGKNQDLLADLLLVRTLWGMGRDLPSHSTGENEIDDLRAQSPLNGRYVLTRKIGAGGMGVVYEADDVELERRVAVKIVRDAKADDLRTIERFKRESRLLAAVNHPNVVAVYDVGTSESGVAFIVMELVEGAAQEFIDGGRTRDWRRVTEIVRDACRGLRAAHDCKILHRDVKPANILLAADGTAKLADFGLAKAQNLTAELSNSNAVQGTLLYMSPEQLAGSPDERSDLYSLGLTWCALLAGRHPLPRAAPDLPNLPNNCLAVIQKAIAEREKRYQTAAELLSAIDALLLPPPSIPSPRRGRALAALGVALVAVLFLGLALTFWPARQRPQAAKKEAPLLQQLRFYVRQDQDDNKTFAWDVNSPNSQIDMFLRAKRDDFKLEGRFDHPVTWHLLWHDTNGKWFRVISSNGPQAVTSYPPSGQNVKVQVSENDPPGIHVLFLLAGPVSTERMDSLLQQPPDSAPPPTALGRHTGELRGPSQASGPAIRTGSSYLERVGRWLPEEITFARYLPFVVRKE